MTPPTLSYMSDNGTDSGSTSAAVAVSRVNGDGSHLSPKVIVRMVIALVFFLIVFAIVGCVAWSRDRSRQSGTHHPHTRRRRGAHTAQVSAYNDLRRQPSAHWVLPPPPYLPPAPSYTTLPPAPPYDGCWSSEQEAAEGIQMTAVGGSGSMPSLPLSPVRLTGRPRAPGWATELQPPPEVHVARHGQDS